MDNPLPGYPGRPHAAGKAPQLRGLDRFPDDWPELKDADGPSKDRGENAGVIVGSVTIPESRELPLELSRGIEQLRRVPCSGIPQSAHVPSAPAAPQLPGWRISVRRSKVPGAPETGAAESPPLRPMPKRRRAMRFAPSRPEQNSHGTSALHRQALPTATSRRVNVQTLKRGWLISPTSVTVAP